jgi:uncharacterized protein YdhG (YjbR/CyaY superfamily)
MNNEHFATIDEYIRASPAGVRPLIEQMRQAIHEAAPDAVEAISYRMPAFRLHKKNLVFFAAFKNHIGFYPIPSGMVAFKKELSPYKQGKGSVRFPLGEPIPYELVKEIVRFRAAEEKK